MTTKQFYEKQKAISNSELAEMAQTALKNLCRSGGRSFTMTIPPRIDDTDMVLSELITRFEALLQANNIELKQPVSGSSKPPLAGWIRTADKQPEKGKVVLCNSIYGIQTGWMNIKGDWSFNNGGSQFTLEHWMPLPELPSVGGV